MAAMNAMQQPAVHGGVAGFLDLADLNRLMETNMTFDTVIMELARVACLRRARRAAERRRQELLSELAQLQHRVDRFDDLIDFFL